MMKMTVDPDVYEVKDSKPYNDVVNLQNSFTANNVEVKTDFTETIRQSPIRKIYIAGPISNGGKSKDPRSVYKAVIESEKYYLAAVRNGWTPLLPHFSYYAWIHDEEDEGIHWDRWMELDLDWIDSCYCLVRIPGESKGADAEVRYAKKKNIRVIKVQSPRDMLQQLEFMFGIPERRKDVGDYF